ncbi:hypothetical protein [Mycoplasma hafezii]|uniref:hypothetical protein n=1 Tax=Mycoplasma hafezii TaxID=525886 RepID=UPI003CF4EEF4
MKIYTYKKLKGNNTVISDLEALKHLNLDIEIEDEDETVQIKSEDGKIKIKVNK